MIVFKPHEALDLIKPYLPDNPIILEAGAYIGSDSTKFARTWPSGHIHAFEPVPELFEKLKEKTKNFANISCYPYALSSHDGIAIFHVAEKPENPHKATQAGSLLAPKERLKHSTIHFPRTINVPTISLDSWAQKYTISEIDMLWLDMQGHELSVLKASKRIVETTQIIFTEVSFIESYENIPLAAEITEWLENNSFRLVGQDYTPKTTHFFGNRLFVKTR